MAPIDIIGQIRSIICKPFKNKNARGGRDFENDNNCVLMSSSSLTDSPLTPNSNDSLFPNNNETKNLIHNKRCSNNLSTSNNQAPPGNSSCSYSTNNTPSSLSSLCQYTSSSCNSDINYNVYSPIEYTPLYSETEGVNLVDDIYPPFYYVLTNKKKEYHICVRLPKRSYKRSSIHIQVNDEKKQLNMDIQENHARLTINLPNRVDTMRMYARYGNNSVYIKVPKLLSRTP